MERRQQCLVAINLKKFLLLKSQVNHYLGSIHRGRARVGEGATGRVALTTAKEEIPYHKMHQEMRAQVQSPDPQDKPGNQTKF